jgi:hypothetical protein
MTNNLFIFFISQQKNFFSQLLAPLIHTEINGKSKTLLMTSTEQMREATKPHLKMTLQGLKQNKT